MTKAVAMITMVLDHMGLVTQCTWLHVIGRAAAPLFFFLVGYSKSYHWQNRLLAYAIALAFFQLLIFEPKTIYFNILFFFIIIQLILIYLSTITLNWKLLLALFIGCNVFSYYIYDLLEYGLLGLEVALFGLFVREQRSYAIPWGIAALTSYCAAQILVFKLFSQGPFYTTIGLFLVIGVYCGRYQQRIRELPKPLRTQVLFLSRYSLPIYFYHYVAIFITFIVYQHFKIS
jgi:uncharacterized membrane protein